MTQKDGKQTFIKDLKVGDEGESPFLVASLSRGRTNRGGVYLNLELGDKSGRMTAKVWDGAESLENSLAEGSVALVRGYVDSYRGTPQFIVREARPLDPAEIHWSDYLRAAARPEGEMRAELWALIKEMPDGDYRRLVTAALRSPEVAQRFFFYPAAKNLHHAYLHGLLEHSLSVGRLAARVAAHYPRLNPSLLIAGAILHDLGKIWEFTPPPKIDYTTLGRLKGHLVMGAEFLGRAAEGLPGFPPEKLEILQHLILSHHGEPEFGAPVKPQLLEALVLHHLDNIDAKLEAVGSFLDNETDDQGWSGYHRLFGGYFRLTPAFESEPAEGETPEPEKPLAAASGENGEDEDPSGGQDEEQSEGWLF